MHDFMVTGIDGLDKILSGGIIRANSVLIEGAPGTGKTTLGIQMICNGITMFKEPGLIITFEEFPRQLYQEAIHYGFNLKELEDEKQLRVLWTSPKMILDSFAGRGDLLPKIVAELGVKRVLIDSVTHFRRVMGDENRLREILYSILSSLKLQGINVVLTKEVLQSDNYEIGFEEYVVDVAMRLYNLPSQDNIWENRRSIEIRKTRGQPHISGRHPFAFGRLGIEVFPYAQSLILNGEKSSTGTEIDLVSNNRRLSTGIVGLDQMLSGGFREGTSNMFTGGAGTGKSIVTYYFLYDGLLQKQNGLLFTFQERSERIIDYAKGIKLDLEKYQAENKLKIHYFSPISLDIDRFINFFEAELRNTGAKRIVIDSLVDLQNSISDRRKLAGSIQTIIKICEKYNATLVTTNDDTSSGIKDDPAKISFGHLFDSIILLSYVETDSEVKKFISVLKMRGSNHAKELREIQISNDGFGIATKLFGLSGILSGHTSGKLQQIVEEILQPIDFTKGLTEMFIDNQIPAEQIAETYHEMLSQLIHLREYIKSYLGLE